MEAVRIRGKLEDEIAQVNREELVMRERKKNLLKLLGEGILIRQRRKADLK